MMTLRNLATLLLLVVVDPASVVAQATWRVDSAPILDVSSTSKTGAILFARVSGATRLQDGTVVIADADDNALHFFDATGKAGRTAGRAGNGPGEFRHITWMGRCGGDSLHVWDMVQRRMAVFGPNGAFIRQYAVPSDSTPKADPMMTLACSSRGVIVYQSQPGVPKTRVAPKNPAMPTREERVTPTTAAVAIGNTIGKVTRQLGEHPSGSMYTMGGGGFPLPLASTTYVAVSGDRAFVGTADSTGTIAVYETNGSVALLKLNLPVRQTTAAQRARAVTAMASLAPKPMRQMAEEELKVAPIPAVLPAYSALFGDADGVLWIQLTVPGDPATRLRAVGPTNATLGEISLPANLVIHEIGRDYVLGAYDDVNDIPHFAVFRLHRGR